MPQLQRGRRRLRPPTGRPRLDLRLDRSGELLQALLAATDDDEAVAIGGVEGTTSASGYVRAVVTNNQVSCTAAVEPE
jgi:hypothetical protein